MNGPSAPTRGSTLHVVTHRRWVAEELARAARGRGEPHVSHSLGLDLPDFSPGDGLWASTEWAARARRTVSTTSLPLADPGAHWVTTLPVEFLGRGVHVMKFDEVADRSPAAAFFKPANAKIEALPAAWALQDTFMARAERAGLPASSDVLVSDEWLELVEEHRVFVLAGEPVTSSPYLLHHGSESTPWNEAMTSTRDAAARTFAARAVEASGAAPPAMTLDVAITAQGRWVVIEANPVWSSAFYGAEPTAVVECLMRANDVAVEPRWHWKPDAWLVDRAQRQRTLR